MKPLLGYNSESNSYLVPSYPYGRTLRCRIRYWMEFSEGKGYRFCSQTEHPTKLIWNAPKKSTYIKFAGAMFLDENEHVQWQGVSEYCEPKNVLQFIKDFPGACVVTLKVWCAAKSIYCNAKVSKATSPSEIEEYKNDEVIWKECLELLKRNDNQ